MLSSKSWISSRTADQLSTRWKKSGSSGAPFGFSCEVGGCGCSPVLSIEIVWRGPSGNIQVTPSVSPRGDSCSSCPSRCRTCGPRAPSTSAACRRADARVEELVAAQDDRSERAGRGERSRRNARDLVVQLRVVARDVDDRDVARDEVHHVSTRVGRVDHDSLRILADRDADDVAQRARRQERGRRIDGRRPVRVEDDADEAVGPAQDDEAFVRAPLERHRDRSGVEELLTDVLELDAPVHVERHAGVHVGRRVEHAEQALDVDVEAERAVRRRARRWAGRPWSP